MKILLTGSTSRHVDSRFLPKSRRVTGVFPAIAQALERAGCEVDHRQVLPGEDLKGKYDFAIVGLYHLTAMGSVRYKFGAFYAAASLPHVFAIDDWQVRNVVTSLGKERFLWRKSSLLNHKGEAEYDTADGEYHLEMDEIRRRVWEEGFDSLLLPFFEWGDRKYFTELHETRDLLCWNPGPWMPQHFRRGEAPDLRATKERRWVCAALKNKDKFIDKEMKPGWPVDRQYKQKTSVQSGNTWNRLSEEEVTKELYAKAWGVVAPRYPHAGSGWWRPRYDYGFQAGSIVYCDDREGKALGEPFMHSVREIEYLSDSGLSELADAQRECFLDYELSLEESAHTLRRSLEEAKHGNPTL